MPWWGLVLTLTLAGGFSRAGLWQLDRAEDKRALEAAFAAGDSAPPAEGLPADPDALRRRYGRIRVEGEFDGAHTVLLDNMSREGRAGYEVLTPFRTRTGTILVNRGWVPGSGDRSVLPPVPVDGAVRTLTGRIDLMPRAAIRLAAAPARASDPWPRRLAFPTTAEIAGQAGYPLMGYQLLLDAEEPDGFRRDWQPTEFGPERHLGYALQWFAMATAVIAIYAGLAVRRRRGASAE